MTVPGQLWHLNCGTPSSYSFTHGPVGVLKGYLGHNPRDTVGPMLAACVGPTALVSMPGHQPALLCQRWSCWADAGSSVDPMSPGNSCTVPLVCQPNSAGAWVVLGGGREGWRDELGGCGCAGRCTGWRRG